MKASSAIGYAILAAAAIYYFGDDSGNSSNTSNQTNSSGNTSGIGSSERYAEQRSRTGSAYGLRATDNSWPTLGESTEAIAANLTSKNYYVVFDGSGSMAKQGCSGSRSKLSVARDSLASFAKSIPSDANIGLFIFDGNGRNERIPLGTGNRDSFIDAINSTRADGGTPLKSAINIGYLALEAQAKRQLGYGEYNLVVVTDGKASSEKETPHSAVERVLEKSPVVIHTVGFCIDSRHSLNQPGKTYYKQANDANSLTKGLSEVLAESPSFDADTFSTN